MKRYHWLLLFLVSIVGFCLSTSVLYNIWFDSLDKIKYNRSYSPESDIIPFWKHFVFYVIVFLWTLVSIFLIVKFVKSKK
jgi:hypothetical protein